MKIHEIIKRIVCSISGHRYLVQRIFSQTSRKVCCARCGMEWGMNDRVRSLIPWDGDLEQMYMEIGQWPGGSRCSEAAKTSAAAESDG